MSLSHINCKIGSHCIYHQLKPRLGSDFTQLMGFFLEQYRTAVYTEQQRLMFFESFFDQNISQIDWQGQLVFEIVGRSTGPAFFQLANPVANGNSATLGVLVKDASYLRRDQSGNYTVRQSSMLTH